MNNWMCGTPAGTYVSMAVDSTGNKYGVADGLMYSFPVTCANGEWTIVDGLAVCPPIPSLFSLKVILRSDMDLALKPKLVLVWIWNRHFFHTLKSISRVCVFVQVAAYRLHVRVRGLCKQLGGGWVSLRVCASGCFQTKRTLDLTDCTRMLRKLNYSLPFPLASLHHLPFFIA